MDQSKARRHSSAEREMERIKKRQEVYMDAMNDLKMLRDHYRDVLREKLEEKVRRQREDREKKKIIKQEVKNKEKNKKFPKIQLPRSEGIEDTEFLKNINVSKFYNIIKIQNHLEKNKELDKKHKLEEFSRLISKPGMVEKSEREIRKGHILTFARLRELANKEKELQDTVTKKQGAKALSPILDEDLESRKGSSLSRKETNSHGDAKNTNNEVSFPVVNYPKLPMINRDLESPGPSQSEVEQSLNLEKKRQNTEKRKFQLSRMFKQSVANEAATARLMNKYKHLNFASLEESSEIKKIVASEDPKKSVNDYITVKEKFPTNPFSASQDEIESTRSIDEYLVSLANSRVATSSDPSRHEGRKEFEMKISYGACDSNDLPQEQFWKARAHSDATIKDQILGKTEKKSEQVKISPLTIQALEETAPVKVVRGPSKLWINPV